MVKSKSSSSARLAVLMIAALALLVSACSSDKVNGSGSTGGQSASGGTSGSASGSAPSTAASSTKPTAVPTKPVHIRLLSSDGNTYGVGMPVIAYFSKRLTDGKALQQATKATADGKPVEGAWYFETSAAGKGPIEGHFRPKEYWPAHAEIHVDIPAKGLSAGKGLAFDDSLTLDFTTGARHIALVNDANHTITVTSDGVQKYKFPVSLGATNTPTAHGTKIIMEKGLDICMRGPGYYECHVKYTQRLTYGGEYLHAAPWNTRNIHNGVDSSNGCTNMYMADAKTLYGFLRIGDVVTYPNANGPAMSLGAGYGDWNISWPQWQTGGLVPTT